MKRWGLLAVAVAALVSSGPVQASAPPVQAQAYVVQSSVDGRTLAARDADTTRPMASLTKLMTVLVALERLSLDEVVTVPAAAARVGESSLDLDAGERRPVRDLVIGARVAGAYHAAPPRALAAAGAGTGRGVTGFSARSGRGPTTRRPLSRSRPRAPYRTSSRR